MSSLSSGDLRRASGRSCSWLPSTCSTFVSRSWLDRCRSDASLEESCLEGSRPPRARVTAALWLGPVQRPRTTPSPRPSPSSLLHGSIALVLSSSGPIHRPDSPTVSRSPSRARDGTGRDVTRKGELTPPCPRPTRMIANVHLPQSSFSLSLSRAFFSPSTAWRELCRLGGFNGWVCRVADSALDR